MTYKVTCSNCEFGYRVQSDLIAQLTKDKHESENKPCEGCCDIEPLKRVHA